MKCNFFWDWIPILGPSKKKKIIMWQAAQRSLTKKNQNLLSLTWLLNQVQIKILESTPERDRQTVTPAIVEMWLSACYPAIKCGRGNHGNSLSHFLFPKEERWFYVLLQWGFSGWATKERKIEVLEWKKVHKHAAKSEKKIYLIYLTQTTSGLLADTSLPVRTHCEVDCAAATHVLTLCGCCCCHIIITSLPCCAPA